MRVNGRVLIIAGSDSSGGAGIQADIKTVTCLGGYAMTAITALTAQNTKGVHAIHAVPTDFIKQQIKVIIEDIGVDSIKIGMVGDGSTIEAVMSVLPDDIPVVLDPVMVAKGGAPLLKSDSIQILKDFISCAMVCTPNLPELNALGGDPKALSCPYVLVKGGHGTGDVIEDTLHINDPQMHAERQIILQASRQHTKHTHGTGCTLAAALATGLAQGMSVVDATKRAHAFVQHAIQHAPGYGGGHGPLGHIPLS